MTETIIRLSCFIGVWAVLALGEGMAPRRSRLMPIKQRWLNHLGLVCLNTMLLRITFPMTAVGMAAFVQTKGWGLWNQLPVPGWVAIVGSLIVLDFLIYLQHVVFHRVPWLWRLHYIHHADLDFDVTTALRFHPLEILLSMGIKMLAVMLLGAPPVAVLSFEVLLNATAMFNHSNIRLSATHDRLLRWILVTPDMHRVHHSILPTETNANYGFSLPWWDYWLGTYQAQPQAGHDGMTIGLAHYRNPSVEQLSWMLTAPFHSGVTPPAIRDSTYSSE
jgi:sterol desaturase/sphingolipid hydroxylase (fatty acid hydroxylase superfamily)